MEGIMAEKDVISIDREVDDFLAEIQARQPCVMNKEATADVYSSDLFAMYCADHKYD